MSTTKLFFIDDSGAEATGVAVYAWLEIDIAHWNTVQGRWLAFRADLARTVGIPASYELHATAFVRGAGNPSRDPAWNRRKSHRGRVATAVLDTIAALPCTRVGAVYRDTPARGAAYQDKRAGLYADLVREFDDRLAADGDHGVVVMDGNGTDPSYRRGHRALTLKTRRIVEDPFFAASHTVQLVQAADLLAYTAYQHHVRQPARSFMWDWWPDHLPHAAPRAPL